MNLENYIVDPRIPVIRAMEAINRNSQGIVYLCEGR